jgi:hypothetical protein
MDVSKKQARQAWRILNDPQSLSATVLKAIYYPNCDLLDSQLGSSPLPCPPIPCLRDFGPYRGLSNVHMTPRWQDRFCRTTLSTLRVPDFSAILIVITLINIIVIS